MDPLSARNLAQKMIPDPQKGVSHDRAADLGLTRSQIQTLDTHPQDGELTQAELAQALQENRLEIDPQSQTITQVKPRLAFVDEPTGPGPQRDLFPGYSALGTRDPKSQPLQGSNPGSYTPPAGISLDALTHKLTTPDQVTQLLQPFGSKIYDHDRADNGTGPGGAQSPEYTLEARKGICRDSHFLGAYILQENGYNARQTGYKSEGIQHAVLTYEGKNHEGFGMIEYGTHYSPEQIAKILGRPALSHEEAVQAVRPEAKIINVYSKPEANQTGYIERLHYTMGHMLYQDTMRLKHENSLEWDKAGGVKLEGALNENWGFKITADTGSSPDPTARNSVSAAVGYQTGNSDDWMRIAAGVQYRPEEGHHSIGPNQWESHPALMLGAHAEGQWTPLKKNLGENHQLRTTLGGELTGALALSQGEGTNASDGKTGAGWKMDQGLMAGMNHATLRLGQHLDGKLSEHFSYKTEAFIAPDIMAMGLGYGTGGKGIYSNVGVNGSLHYQNSGFGAYVGGQYLALQANNLEATGASTGISYSKGIFSVRSDNSFLDSPEGWRLRTTQAVDVKLTDSIKAYGYATQEQIFNSTYGHFKNDTGMNVGVGLQARF
ncbi:hypothetical protein COW36_03380 [bacterium (Candidatus Blackallbacteria) CG17_big_fil_post_rev_8_21_14_2_50_48_46]|uniref:Uncharacterized protein n=1 Tax=bacterium (Candidatus Blackallbacteria) CG17_big_fil_post_rev_8_21_14_2_50_48_46 TaxID=2014261 RepID=A0A2M7G9P6_9BACT|nr:MAG: hypothetical protein COW64_05620 [bacterium (Candidatus Blackallbacteria) CG18_big_fil_WC_8_21_14_2_50_49_26]PIW18832.1 MAG: hypothetical protein COW36_03380 [bacterium (Candidatus Blackallbacteria) CG17_big_fil_post_rev_8_21_14_2_50_48_46]PIW49287.1 MAG: hypothetical protein COW20_06530 [bacterium (Candidatus Blackallbacteria) CG13_big_fil_rev_8_21_14_2_50_49_14]